ncbi:MAG TPA: peptidylprolyl isomerase [Anaerolineales bacterium]|nr:peptidylprolyl isomerase [Anaerolineales bacterium]
MKQRLVLILLISLLTAACGTVSPPSTATLLPFTPAATPSSCTPLTADPTPGPDDPSLFPPITENDHSRGPSNAAVTILAYTDYQDLYSAVFWDSVNRLLSEHPNDVRVVNRNLPLLETKDKSALAAQAVEAADEQGKYWEMHDLLYAEQPNWINLSVEDFTQWITAQAAGLEMNVEQFTSDLTREDIVAKVRQAWEDGLKIGLPGTPIVLINEQIYTGPRDFNSLNDIVLLILFGKRQFTTCPPFIIQPNRQYIATLHTEKGDVIIELYADKTPITVNSFVFLARSGWYDNITFHRVIPDLFAQTGDPSGTGKGHPGYFIITEILPSLTFNQPGRVAMVNSGPNTSGSQFFITYAPAPQFDGRYTIFGQVLNGMEVLESLTPRDPQFGTPAPPGDQLLSVTIEEK